jgi:hypothetical protein
MDIPVSFEYEGIQFEGAFDLPSGAGSWQLNLNGYHYGQLVKYSTGWKWCPNPKNLFTEDYMEKFFIETVESYLRDQANVT